MQHNAQLDDLRQTLSEQGWQDKTINCSDPDCNSAKMYGLNDLIFLDYSDWLRRYRSLDRTQLLQSFVDLVS
jgi:hypothetical protein